MVYVDDYRGRFRNMIMSHLMADGVRELHVFAARLGLKRSWFRDGSAPHYDVSQSMRREALRLGAVDLPIIVNGRHNPLWSKLYCRLRARKLKAAGGE